MKIKSIHFESLHFEFILFILITRVSCYSSRPSSTKDTLLMKSRRLTQITKSTEGSYVKVHGERMVINPILFNIPSWSTYIFIFYTRLEIRCRKYFRRELRRRYGLDLYSDRIGLKLLNIGYEKNSFIGILIIL